jgi:hypothetical protein
MYQMMSKLDMGCITPGLIVHVIPFFPVPKPDDIRVVWDLRLNGVNETVYTPSFQLPTQHLIIDNWRQEWRWEILILVSNF